MFKNYFIYQDEDSVFQQNKQNQHQKAEMFKNRLEILCILFLVSYSQVVPDISTLAAATNCLGNCHKCDPNAPQKCIFEPSLKYVNQNFNCIDYYFGKDCTSFSNGFSMINSGIENWTGPSSQNLGRTTCPFLKNKIPSLGLFQNISISKRIENPFSNTNAFVIQFGLFIKVSKEEIDINNTQTDNRTINQEIDLNDLINGGIGGLSPQTIQTITAEENGFRYFLRNFNVSIQSFSWTKTYQLQYQYQSITVEESSRLCGKYFQFVVQVIPPPGLDLGVFTLQINSEGAPLTFWSLADFKVSVGCSSFMLFTQNLGCSYCQSGFYAIRNSDSSVSSCALCPTYCQTCTDATTCLSCNQANEFTTLEEGCLVHNNYVQIDKNKVVSGDKFVPGAESPLNGIFKSIFKTTRNKIEIQNQQQNTRSFTIEFYLLYLEDMVNQSGEAFQIFVNNTLQKTIQASELNKAIGFYDRAFFPGNATQKILAHKVKLSKMIIQSNAPQTIRVLVNTTNNQLGTFAVADLMILQEKCPNNCKDCNLQTRACSACNSFFLVSSNCQSCPNGMFLQKAWNQAVDLNQDTCIKCHATCKQCSGPTVSQCTECLNPFRLQRIEYNISCIECIFNQSRNEIYNISTCSRCLPTFTNDSYCSACLQQGSTLQSLLSSNVCQQCWLNSKLASSRCIPIEQSGYQFYGADLTEGFTDEKSWSVTPSQYQAANANLTKDYLKIWGIPNLNASKTSQETSLEWKTELPPHNGIIILFNLILTGIRANKSVQIIFGGQTDSLQVQNTSGSDIDQKPGNQMLYTYVVRSSKHSTSNVNLKVSTTGGGIFLRQFQVYLKDCSQCILDELVYQVGYIPRYEFQYDTPKGLDVWLDFGKKVEVASSTNLAEAFTFSFIEIPEVILEPANFTNELQSNNRLKYFLPLQFSFINFTLAINTTEDQNIFSQQTHQVPGNVRRMLTRMLLVSKLNLPRSQNIIDRYSDLNKDDEISVFQLYWFFRTFQWFALIVMIVCAFFGFGVVFQDFSIMLQILFLHVYISSNLLPASYKAPMWGLERIENLNFFADPHAANIENQWFGDKVYPSPYIFQQYNTDIYFARAYYPIIIINLIYLGWFILLTILHKAVKAFKNSQNRFAIFFRNIPERPINYFDQIWRYQFLTTCWASFLQFYNLNGRDGSEVTNIVLCFFAFIISIIWPIFIIFYTSRKSQSSYNDNFLYYYQDIFFKKIQTDGQQNWKYHFYIAVRFLRIIGIAFFISLFTNHELVSPIVLIFLNIIETVYVAHFRIFYKDILAMFLKIAENVLFIFIEITLLIVYGFSNTMEEKTFLNLGYSLIVLYVITIILALVRFVYYLYSKFRNITLNFYGLDGGQKKEYQMTPLPKNDQQ